MIRTKVKSHIKTLANIVIAHTEAFNIKHKTNAI